MQGRRLVGAVRMAHVDLETELAALVGAEPARRPALLERVIRLAEATSSAEEAVLFPALRNAMGDDETAMAETCLTEHRDMSDRLKILAGRPAGAGFDTALIALVGDMRDHQHDEVDTVLPVLTEALGEEGSATLAEVFSRALEAARAQP